MIDDIVNNYYYWGFLFLLLFIGSRAIGARLLDFKFLVLLLLSQYFLHALIAFGLTSEISGFCLAFLAIFILFTTYAVGVPQIREFTEIVQAACGVEGRWIVFAKWYLLLYYLARIVMYPYVSSELLLDYRLSAQQENRLLFFLGLAVLPALVAWIYSLLLRRGHFGLFDYAVAAVVVFGMLGSGSKSAALPLVLAYIGTASYLGRNILNNAKSLLVIGVLIGLTIYALTLFFPSLTLQEIAFLIQYRIAANTDNLEYLKVTGLDPRSFPFAGLGALIPMLAKLVGYTFDFSPGVWLHGMRFGDWTGFGPNSGIVLDYFGNLGWLGLLVPALLGIYVRACIRVGGVIGCSFLAIAHLAVIDVAIFDVTMLFWGAILLILMLTSSFRLPERWLHLFGQKNRAC